MCGQVVSRVLGDFAETLLGRDAEIGGLGNGVMGCQIIFYLVYA